MLQINDLIKQKSPAIECTCILKLYFKVVLNFFFLITLKSWIICVFKFVYCINCIYCTRTNFVLLAKITWEEDDKKLQTDVVEILGRADFIFLTDKYFQLVAFDIYLLQDKRGGKKDRDLFYQF